MPAVTARGAVVMAVVLVTLATGCGTKVVDLVLPDGGNSADRGIDVTPPGKCQAVMRADGSVCQICFLPDGQVVSSTCPPFDADAGPGPVTPPEMCKVVPTGDSRCLICYGPGDMNTMPCLKCDAPVRTSEEGDFCRACGWTDRAGSCLQCFSGEGTVTHDDCDRIRSGP